MKARVFWIVSLTLVLLAIFLHLNALGAAMKHVDYVKRSMSAAESQKEELKAEARHFGRKADWLVTSGWLVAVIGLVSLFTSYRKGESALRSIVVVLLAFYVLLQFAVI